MQRGTYHPPPAHSPPLHHPVPQHVSTVPMMRSPPPPQASSNYAGSPYAGQMGGAQQGQTQGGQFAPNFGGFMNDQTAQMGFQVGQKAVMAGQEYMEQSVRSPSHVDLLHINTHSSQRALTDKPLRLHLGPKTLLQRLHPLRPPQNPPRPLPLAPQTLVPRTAPFSFVSRPQHRRHRRILLPLPPPTRRPELSRHVHPRHGLRDLHPTLHAARRTTRGLPPRGDGADGDGSLRGRGR